MQSSFVAAMLVWIGAGARIDSAQRLIDTRGATAFADQVFDDVAEQVVEAMGTFARLFEPPQDVFYRLHAGFATHVVTRLLELTVTVLLGRLCVFVQGHRSKSPAAG